MSERALETTEGFSAVSPLITSDRKYNHGRQDLYVYMIPGLAYPSCF